MALFNTAFITDLHVRDIVEREDISIHLEMLDNEIKSICISKGVAVDLIPVNDDGFITSSTLISYSLYWLYCKLLLDFHGGAGELSDIYSEKCDRYLKKIDSYKADLTYSNILNVNLNSKSFIRSVVIY